jgi:hypothetical protein
MGLRREIRSLAEAKSIQAMSAWKRIGDARVERFIKDKLKSTHNGLAEREGFEPSVQFPVHTLSKRAP